MPPKIQENAIFLADSHHSFYNNSLDEFFDYLLTLSPRQIFLLGDIFDFLVGNIEKSIKDNQQILEKLEKISKIHNIYYFEGNHDFLLKNLSYFKAIKYYPIKKQPALFLLNKEKIFLAHGDIYNNLSYKIYTALIRNKAILTLLNSLDSFLFLYDKIISHLKNKDIRYIFDDVENFVQKRIQKYIQNTNESEKFFIIEGHFHIGKSLKFNSVNYYGIPCFSCKKKYFIVEFKNNCLSLIQKEFFSG